MQQPLSPFYESRRCWKYLDHTGLQLKRLYLLTRRPGVLLSMGSQTDTTELLNWSSDIAQNNYVLIPNSYLENVLSVFHSLVEFLSKKKKKKEEVGKYSSLGSRTQTELLWLHGKKKDWLLAYCVGHTVSGITGTSFCWVCFFFLQNPELFFHTS